MKRSTLIPLILVGLVAGCTSPRDPLEDAALQASRAGTLVAMSDQGRTTAAVEAGSRLAENFYFIAKYEASKEQREFVKATAPKAAAKARSPKRKKPAVVQTERPTAKPEKKTAPEPKPSRYIAVKTKQDSRAKSKTSVMVWDTQSQEIVGNNVYDLNAAPPDGSVIRFETFSAEYVAAGL